MIIPCIDLMGGKVVQLIQGNEESKVLELDDVPGVAARFASFPQIQVIDLDAALGRKAQAETVSQLCRMKSCRVGGGIRSVERALEVARLGALKVIVGSAAFTPDGIDRAFLEAFAAAIPWEHRMIAVDCLNDHVAIHGWREVLALTSKEVLPQLEPYCSEFLCTCVDVEGKHQGTRIDWFRGLRSATALPITAAGGITTESEIKELETLGMNAALGVSIYRRMFPELFQSAVGAENVSSAEGDSTETRGTRLPMAQRTS
jgi:phosphoribosylformimino-5-aminoimidazole carboxamide ribonucleotide (ProFAR) isomerase